MEITITDYQHRNEDGKLDFPEVKLEVRFTKRSWGGWNVVRADNGRELGWLAKGKFDNGKPCWNAYIDIAAFRGAGKDDEGYVLDEVPLRLARYQTEIKAEAIAYEETREEGACEIFQHLYRNEAPAVGFGRHHSVKRWHDTHPVI